MVTKVSKRSSNSKFKNRKTGFRKRFIGKPAFPLPRKNTGLEFLSVSIGSMPPDPAKRVELAWDWPSSNIWPMHSVAWWNWKAASVKGVHSRFACRPDSEQVLHIPAVDWKLGVFLTKTGYREGTKSNRLTIRKFEVKNS